jgi:hypothetical protein
MRTSSSSLSFDSLSGFEKRCDFVGRSPSSSSSCARFIIVNVVSAANAIKPRNDTCLLVIAEVS